MTYEIVKDLHALEEFISWLPKCGETEKYYLCLFSRRKYVPHMPHIKSDKGQLKRFLADESRIVKKIIQLECRFGSYCHGDVIVPQEALALYITPTPRDLYKATIRSIGKLAQLIESQGKNCNPHQEVLSEIQRTPSKNKKIILFDLDWKDKGRLLNCIDIVNGFCDVVETRGGYHLFVHKDKVEKIPNKMWYQEIKKHADVSGDNMTPVVGCSQGGFVPRFILKDGEWRD